MKKYQFDLARSYRVSIAVENEEMAKRFAEFYTGNPGDDSTVKQRTEHKFSIDEIEMVWNDAMEVAETDS